MTEYTEVEREQRVARAKIMMLWFGIISLSMMFAGLTSAYIVSQERRDWLTDFELPNAFYISTGIIILSSLFMIYAKQAIKKGRHGQATIGLMGTLALGITFVALQFVGFEQIIEMGYFFTGTQSTVTTSFIYAFVISHVAHIAAGIIVLIVVLVNHLRKKYTVEQHLGLTLGATFWHFVDILWVYLFLFLLYA
ncbi:cytochrome c oxidase subunit 3 [Croceiramulus getboli]|nr:cytochrome c oxidase subunit 3 [Flavobacteriaceae bacterium YJPT1-3]